MTEPALESSGVGDSRLPTLTSLRWYAALVVLLYHAQKYTGWRPLSAFSWGEAGVSFFFVLSGFVLTWSYNASRAVQSFWWRRVARIYPAHLVTWIAAAALGAVTGLFGHRLLGVALGALLLQAWSPSTSIVYRQTLPPGRSAAKRSSTPSSQSWCDFAPSGVARSSRSRASSLLLVR